MKPARVRPRGGEMGAVAEPSSDHRVHVAAAASAFGLGAVEAEPVLAARGYQGRVWRVKTRRGDLAVKELVVGLTEREVQVDVMLQSTMVNRGVPAPQPLRTGRRSSRHRNQAT